MVTTEDFVSFETAKLLRDKGFDGMCFHIYRVDGMQFYCATHRAQPTTNEKIEEENKKNPKFKVHECTCPTLQMATKWLRENHNLYVTSVPNGIGEYVFYPWIYKKFEWGWNVLESSLNGFQNTEFNSPEEACEAAIKYCLENLI